MQVIPTRTIPESTVWLGLQPCGKWVVRFGNGRSGKSVDELRSVQEVPGEAGEVLFVCECTYFSSINA